MTRRLGVNAAYVAGQIVPGDVVVEGDTIDEVGVATGPGPLLAVPGFVDLQVNGFGGIDYATADVGGYGVADRALAATGVTSYQPTLISLPWSDYPVALATGEAALPTLGGRMLGLHIEGPFLARGRCGAHDPDNLLEPTPDRVRVFADSAAVTWMTLAPELEGAMAAISQLVGRQIGVAVGHTDADATTAQAAFEAGATAVTHLFNAQSSMSHRAPGVPGAALDRPGIALSLIVDGHHLAEEVVRLVFRVAPERVVLVTDAIAGAGIGDGPAVLGDRTVTVTNGRAALADGTLAGSVLAMDEAVRNCVALGISLEQALAAATSNPARTRGLADRGRLVPGARADVAILDDDLGVVSTLSAGEVLFER